MTNSARKPKHEEPELHVVFGAGQVGSPLAAKLLAAGKRVRVVKRSPWFTSVGAELMLGNADDQKFCIEATAGAAAVYHCMNPPYSAPILAKLVPLYMENLIVAAGSAGARLVVLDNLYMLGRTGGTPMNEDTPMNPCSKKGQIRAAAATRLFDAHRRGEVRAVSGRAADFYGPRGTESYFGEEFWKPALEGRTVRMPLNPDAIHTYHYIPDVAEGLASLGCAGKDVLGQAWMLPCEPAVTMRELAARFAKVLGRPIRIARVPWIAIAAVGVFVPIFREMREMLYQWGEPFIVDDRRFRKRFKISPTEPTEAARATVEWAKDAYTVRLGD